ncbi:cytochrome P450 2A6-like [Spea bombifrons]|uniref:cytochrome P450 2A6-like n=1 Tax=Spea bombifrons TaxID=233779 RepID=UPI00234B7600|nr:cytochrome P450 2A6-like [Spea bombifrons]
MLDVKTPAVALVAFATVFLMLALGKFVWKRRKMPPGPFPLPLLGNYLQLRSGNQIQTLMKLSEKYGPVFTVYFGPRPNVVLVGYKAVKEMPIDHGDSVLGRGEIPIFFDLYNRCGLPVANGDHWKQLRQFSRMTLRDFGMGKKSLEEPIQTEARHMVNVFRNTKQHPVDPGYTLICASSNVIASVLMGTRYDYNDQKWLNILSDMCKAFSITSSPSGRLYDMFPSLMRILPRNHQNFFKLLKGLRDVVKEQARRHLETLDPACPRDYIDCFLLRMKQENMKLPFDMKNLISTIFDMFLGGAETTAVTIKFGFLVLIKYPEIQVFYEEIEQVIGFTRDPMVEDRSKMPYMNAVIHEIQRFSDVLPLGVARSATSDIHFRGYLIPEKTDVLPVLTTVLNDPTQFETPHKFNVKHFLDENGKFMKNNGFLPFSAGKRNCIGESLTRMQLFIFFASVLQKCTLKPTVAPKDLDINPVETSFENIPPVHKIIFIPRE